MTDNNQLQKINDAYSNREIIKVFVDSDKEIQDLKKSINKNIFIYTDEWNSHQKGKGETNPIKEAWDKRDINGSYYWDYIIWPIQGGSNYAWDVVIIDVKKAIATIHSPSHSIEADRELKDLSLDLDKLGNKQSDGTFKDKLREIKLDILSNPEEASGHDTKYIAIMYVINALKLIKSNSYDYDIDTSTWYDIKVENGNKSDFEVIKEKYEALVKDVFDNYPTIWELATKYYEYDDLNTKYEDEKTERTKAEDKAFKETNLKDNALKEKADTEAELNKIKPLLNLSSGDNLPVDWDTKLKEEIDKPKIDIVYTPDEIDIFNTIGLTDSDTEKKECVKECYRLILELNNKKLIGENNGHYIKLSFAGTLGTGVNGNTSLLSDGNAEIHLKLDRKDINNNFSAGLVMWTLTHETSHAIILIKQQSTSIKYVHDFIFWDLYLWNNDFSTYQWFKDNISDKYWKEWFTLTQPSLIPDNIDFENSLTCYFPERNLDKVYNKYPAQQPADKSTDDLTFPIYIKNLTKDNVDSEWKRTTEQTLKLCDEEIKKGVYDENSIDYLWVDCEINKEDDGTFTISIYCHVDSPFKNDLEKVIFGSDDNVDTTDLNNQLTAEKDKSSRYWKSIGILTQLLNDYGIDVDGGGGTTTPPITSTGPLLLNSSDDGGFTPEKLQEIINNKQDRYETSFDGVLTAELLDKLLEDAKVKVGIEVDKTPFNVVDKDLDDFLISIKGYRIEDEPEIEIKVENQKVKMTGLQIVTQENKWQADNEVEYQGKLKLPFFYAKNNFDPDNLTIDNYCSFEKDNTGKKKLKEINGALQGSLAIGTGVGKTTKTVACLCRGGQQNIILVTPTDILTHSAYNHHSDWLQTYKCVYHGVAHGTYKTAINDLTQYKDSKGKLYGNKGVSVLKYTYLLGYMARELLDVGKITISSVNKEYARVIKGLEDAKNKMIPDDTIIIFDEAHFNITSFQQIFREVVFLEDNNGNPRKKVILMSATFKGKPFSITSSFPIESREVNKFSTNTKFTDDRYKDFDEYLAKSQTLLFVENVEDLDLSIVEKVPCVTFNETNNEVAEGISQGVPLGGLMIANSDARLGLNLNCQVIVDTAMEELVDIRGGWVKTVTSKPYSEPNLIQGRGRGGRGAKAIYLTISTKTEEAGGKPNLLSAMVKAVFGDTSGLQKSFFTKYKKNDEKAKLVECIKASFAFEDKWGRTPEAILIGLLPIMTATDNFPNWLPANKKPASANDDLWKQYLGTYEPPKIEPDQAEQTLFLMIDTKLNQLKDLSNYFIFELKSPLVKQANLKLNDDESVTKIRSVLNKVIEKQLEKLDDYKEDQTIYNNTETFNKVVAFYNMLDKVDISIKEVVDKNSVIDKDWAVKINYIAT